MERSDLYQEILGIPVDQSPPHYYQLLQIDLFESDGRAIHAAGLTQIKKLREWQLHPEVEIRQAIQAMLNEVSMACSVLEIMERKEAYDHDLARQLGIDLGTLADYKPGLTVATQLQNCPNCGALCSELAILCIECGYNFETETVLQTMMDHAPTGDEEQTVLPPSKLYLSDILKYAAVGLLFVGLLGWGAWRWWNRPKEFYTIDGNRYLRVSSTKRILDKSHLWKTFCSCYAKKNGRLPHVNVLFKKERTQEYKGDHYVFYKFEVSLMGPDRIAAECTSALTKSVRNLDVFLSKDCAALTRTFVPKAFGTLFGHKNTKKVEIIDAKRRLYCLDFENHKKALAFIKDGQNLGIFDNLTSVQTVDQEKGVFLLQEGNSKKVLIFDQGLLLESER